MVDKPLGPNDIRFEASKLPTYSNEELLHLILHRHALPYMYPSSWAAQTSQWLHDNRGDEWVFREFGYHAFIKHGWNLGLDSVESIVTSDFALDFAKAEKEDIQERLKESEQRLEETKRLIL